MELRPVPAGLSVVIGATILNIAVTNVPRAARGWGLLRGVVIILAVIAAVFGVGIVLVPYLADTRAIDWP